MLHCGEVAAPHLRTTVGGCVTCHIRWDEVHQSDVRAIVAMGYCHCLDLVCWRDAVRLRLINDQDNAGGIAHITILPESDLDCGTLISTDEYPSPKPVLRNLKGGKSHERKYGRLDSG
ncbi:hypothetical protein AnigIFM50267_007333 [Aspergillus niger]|nr:hypothetical protein AnigIFM50267_007333 [Aspergillus niger]